MSKRRNSWEDDVYAPWRYQPVGDSDGELVGIDHFVIDRDGDELACAPTEEIARLMAAAPFLYTACQAVAAMATCEDAAEWKDAFARLTRMCRSACDEVGK